MERKEFENLLTGLNRALRLFSFYPVSHPATSSAAESLFSTVDNLIKKYDKIIEIEISRNSFTIAGEIIENHPTLSPLAYELFKRRIKKLFFLPGITPQELKSFLIAISMDIDSVEKAGGIDKILIQYKVQNIWINEIDFSLRKELKEQGPPVNFNAVVNMPKAESPEFSELQRILTEVESYVDTPQFKTVLKRIRNLAYPFIEEKQWYQLLSALEVLSHIASSPFVSDESRELTRKTILSLINREVLNFLIQEYLASPLIRAREIILIFQQAGRISYPFILRELIENEDKVERRKLIQLSARMGKSILDYLYRLLDDKRWYILRNILLIIGEIEDPESLPYIEIFLQYPDIRVKREAIRAYAKISQGKSIKKLKGLYKKGDKETKKIIANALKLIREKEVTDFTIELFEKEKNKEIKELLLSNLSYLPDKERISNYLKKLIIKNTSATGKPKEVAIDAIQSLNKMGTGGTKILLELNKTARGNLKKIIESLLSHEQ